jgi:hypothetical protein
MTTSAIRASGRSYAPATSTALAISWQLAAVVFAATSVIVGLIWDISWHMTIGRDTFWTPAHLAIYTGGAVAGLASGFEVLRRSFFQRERAHDDVTVWRIFHGPLGGWLCIWGAVAMLTSAPFDDWWHDAYGLDVKIISPPHAVLALGFITILAGAVLMAVREQSRHVAHDVTRGEGVSIAPWIVAYTTALVLVMLGIFSTEYHDRTLMHAGIFYIVSALAFPAVLVASIRSTRLSWPATTAATMYTVVVLLQLWILPLFEGSPKLGPIRTPVTHMVPMDFPLLLLPAALAMDVVFRRVRERGAWTQALALGTVFMVVHVATQWPFADFLMSDASRNALFRTDNFAYMMPRDWLLVLGKFETEPVAVTVQRLGIAMAISVLAARIGLTYGNWLRTVQR